MMIRAFLERLGPQRLMVLCQWLRPDTEFVVFREQRLVWRDIFTRVHKLAAGLQAMGIQKGDRIVTLLPACPEAVDAFFLPWVLGTFEVPLNPLLRDYELRHILADCGATAVITTRRWYGHDYPAMLERLLPDLPGLRYVIVRDANASDNQTFFSLDDVMASEKPLRQIRLSFKDIGRISYTSGTTGVSKGVVHTWNRYLGLLHPAALLHLNPRVLRCMFFPFPLCTYTGVLGVMAALLSGGKIFLPDRFNPREMLGAIQRERVSLVAGTPTMYRLMLRTPEQERYDLSSVRRVLFGTEPCPPDLAQALHERFGCSLENMYGTNETGNVTWGGLNDPWERAATTVGKLVPGARVRIVDDERRPLLAGEQGEIAAQTPQMMIGYYRDPELTTQALDAEGWFYTGDVGYLGEDGYLRLVGRKNDVIIRGGQNIYPEEVEGYLEQHPAVRRAGVVGVPRDVGGEAVWAYLELYPGATLTVRDVLDFCRGQIAPFKIPEQVHFIERLPMTVSDKVQRFKLREMANNEGRGAGGEGRGADG